MGLTTHHWVVVRRAEGRRWQAGLGLGGLYADLVGSWDTERGATRAAIEAWRRRCANDARANPKIRYDDPVLPNLLVLEPGESVGEEASAANGRKVPEDIWDEPLTCGTNQRERVALERVRGGLRIDRRNRMVLAELLARARGEGCPLA